MAYWGKNSYWQSLSDAEKAAAMALLEAGQGDKAGARNVLGVIVNRAAKDGVPVGESVSSKTYQPTIEDNQFAKLSKVIGSPEHKELIEAYNQRVSGATPDWVNGATHFLAPEKSMLALEAQDPQKYRSWRKWTGFNPETNEYSGVTFRDNSHAFLAPEGAHSAAFDPSGAVAPTAVASASPPPAPAPVKAPTQTAEADPSGMLSDIVGSKGGSGASGEVGAVVAAAIGLPPEVGRMAGNFLGGGGGEESSKESKEEDPMDLAAKESIQNLAAADQQSKAALAAIMRNGTPAPDLSRLAAVIQNRKRLGA